MHIVWGLIIADIVAVEPTPFIRGILGVRRLFQRRRNQITVTAGAAEALPVDAHSVDAIWAVNTMHHWIDINRATTEIRRALRSGGRIVLIDENFEDPQHPDYERWTANHSDDHAHHGFSMIDTAHIAALLVEVGLDDVVASERLLADRARARSDSSSTGNLEALTFVGATFTIGLNGDGGYGARCEPLRPRCPSPRLRKDPSSPRSRQAPYSRVA